MPSGKAIIPFQEGGEEDGIATDCCRYIQRLQHWMQSNLDW